MTNVAFIENIMSFALLCTATFCSYFLSVNIKYWFDEFFSITFAAQDFDTLLKSLYAGLDTHPPAHYLLLRVAHWLTGSYRFLSVATFFFSGIILQKTANQLCGSPLVAILCYTNCLMFEFSWEARPYGFMGGLGILSLYFTSKGRNHSLFVILLLSNYNHLYGVFLQCGMLISSFCWPANTDKKNVIFFHSLISLLSLPAFLQGIKAFQHFKSVRKDISVLSTSFFFNDIGAVYFDFLTPKLVPILFCIILLVSKTEVPHLKSHAARGIAISSFTCLSLSLLLSGKSSSRYIAFSGGALALLLSLRVKLSSFLQIVMLGTIGMSLVLTNTIYHITQEQKIWTNYANMVDNSSATLLTDTLSLPALHHYLEGKKNVCCYIDANGWAKDLIIIFQKRGYCILNTMQNYDFLGNIYSIEYIYWMEHSKSPIRQTFSKVPDTRFISRANKHVVFASRESTELTGQ